MGYKSDKTDTYLAVDSDLKIAYSEAEAWNKIGFKMERVDNMNQGIHKLMANDYFFVGINDNVTDFFPLLPSMRSITQNPLLIAAWDFKTEDEVKAINSGADLYAPFRKQPKENIESVLAHIRKIAEQNKTTRILSEVFAHKKLIISPMQHNVFVGNERVDLTSMEFDILYYLCSNQGVLLTSKDIYVKVWGEGHKHPSDYVLRNHISRIRHKLIAISPECDYIETIHGTGYKFHY